MSALPLIAEFVLLIHYHLGTDWIEHAIYGDMTETVRYTTNWDNFMFNFGWYSDSLMAFVGGFIAQAIWWFTIYSASPVPLLDDPLRREDSFGAFAWLTNFPLEWRVHNFNNIGMEATVTLVGVIAGYTVSVLHHQLKFLDQERIKDRLMTIDDVAALQGDALSEASDGDYAEQE